jgi:hypothetical protein
LCEGARYADILGGNFKPTRIETFNLRV